MTASVAAPDDTDLSEAGEATEHYRERPAENGRNKRTY